MEGKGRRKKTSLEVQICPCCLSSNIFRVGASTGDMTGALALLPPKYACSDCGWVGRIVIMRDLEASEDLPVSNDEGKET